MAPRAEDVRHLGVGHEVHVALAVARLHVREAVPLLRQRAERLRQEAHAARLDRQLPALRCGERSLGLHDVADVDLLEARVGFAQRRFADEVVGEPKRELRKRVRRRRRDDE